MDTCLDKYCIDTFGYFGPVARHSGFLRDSRGTFTIFDVPGAVDYSLVYSEGQPGSSLSPSGEATGGYYYLNGNQHGFVRDNYGAITTFDAPEAVNGTIPLSINAAGEVTGYIF